MINALYTLVYGTGFYYPSWMDNSVGWTLGNEYSPDWFNTATAWGIGEGAGGWFGPACYRPPYVINSR